MCRFAKLVVGAREPCARSDAVLAGPAQQARGADHQQRRVEALAGDVADDEADAPVRQLEVIVEIARDLVRRQVHAEHREHAAAALGQQRFLQLAREIELALHALLLDQLVGHARVVDRERGRRRDQAQHLGVFGVERVAVAAVDELDHADRSGRRAERRAEKALGDEPAGLVAGAPDTRIGRGIGDDLRCVLGDGEADHALPDREAHAGHVDRPDADAAFEHACRGLEQEQRGAFGLHEVGDARDRFGQRLAKVERYRERLRKIGQERERAHRVRSVPRCDRRRDAVREFHVSLRSALREARRPRWRMRPISVMTGPEITYSAAMPNSTSEVLM